MNKRLVVGKIVLGKTDVPIEDFMKFTKKLIQETIIIKIPKKRLKQIESRAKRAGLSVTDYMLAAVDAFESAFKPRKKDTEIVLQAIEVFGNVETAILWFNEPNPALNNKSPISLLTRPAGRRLVHNILGQIKHGIYS